MLAARRRSRRATPAGVLRALTLVGLLIAIVLPTLLGGLPFVWRVPLARA